MDEKHEFTNFRVRVYGDTFGEMNQMALEKAEEFFGPGVHLRVRPGFTISNVVDLAKDKASGKQFTAEVLVDLI